MLTYLNLKYVVRCAIWYHLYNLKNMKNTHGGVLILVKLQAAQVAQHITYIEFNTKNILTLYLQPQYN